MHLTYPPLPECPQVDFIPQKYFKMSREEYSVLFDVVKKVTEDKVGIVEMLELGAGEGASAAVFLLATQDMKHGSAVLTSVDINQPDITTRAIKEAVVDLGTLAEWLFRHRRVVSSTLHFQKYHTRRYAVALVDAEHEHVESYRDIRWALGCSNVVVAHDICHPGTEHIDAHCKELSKEFGKKYLAVEVGYGLGIIY
jgi:predicted O-methyltransferase YrrM